MKFKNSILFFFVSLTLFILSCSDWTNGSTDDECEDPDYSDCNTTEPISAPLKISLTINDENPKPEIIVYYGDYEDQIIADTLLPDSENFESMQSIGEEYSLALKYVHEGDTIVAIDGTKLKKKSKTNCDSTCWTVSGGEIDLRLKL